MVLFSLISHCKLACFSYVFILLCGFPFGRAFFNGPHENCERVFRLDNSHMQNINWGLIRKSRKTMVYYSKITPSWALDNAELKEMAREAIDLVEGRFDNVRESSDGPNVSDLKVGDYYMGTVKAVFDYGAFVDIGCGKDGLLHVSHLSDDKIIEDAREIISVGKKIKVHIVSVDYPNVKFELSTKRRDGSRLEDLKNGMELEGKVSRIMSWGAFIDVGFEKDGLLHVTRIQDEVVKDVHDVLKVGQQIKAHVVHLDRKKQTFGLSMRSIQADRHLDYLHGDKKPKNH
uniref:S1 motif domain-containing protein n=1 Tax=Corethron hystrix TaxID=216773 RepID=A0A7S1G1P9_9STRA|mmetsp:Transcript_6661/g.14361  ORF Transcript_6661/g.14361 Transcript_6661/m.14361 type:complete len:288 (+) Transcript_6661:187-1050(+)